MRPGLIIFSTLPMLSGVALAAAPAADGPAVVNEGQMQQSLLGMGYLRRWGRIEIAGGELILTR